MRADVDSKDRQQKVTEHTGISDQEGEGSGPPPGRPAGISTSTAPSAPSPSQGSSGHRSPSRSGLWKPSLGDLPTNQEGGRD